MYEELLKVLRKEKIVAILRDVPLEKFEDTLDILKEEIGKTFSTVLEHAGVFKRDDTGKKAFKNFTDTL